MSFFEVKDNDGFPTQVIHNLLVFIYEINLEVIDDKGGVITESEVDGVGLLEEERTRGESRVAEAWHRPQNLTRETFTEVEGLVGQRGALDE